MYANKKIQEIVSRIEHLENAAEWIARESVHLDNTISQTGTLITAIAFDIRERLNELYEFMQEDTQFN